MKKISTLLKLCFCLLAFACAQVSSAAVFNVGYAQTSDVVYPADPSGYSFNFSDSVHVAVRLTADMLEPYQKGKLTKIMLGWGDLDNKPGVKVWVRKSLNGADIAIGKGSLKFGWNTITLATPLDLSENTGELIVGYTTKVEPEVNCIPTRVYGSTYPNSQYIGTNFDLTEYGDVDWSDQSEIRPIYLIAQVEAKNSETSNMAKLRSYTIPMHISKEKGGSALSVIENVGSNAITKLTMTFTQGEWSHNEEIKLSQALASGKSATMYLPVFADHSGDVEVSISQVNAKENNVMSRDKYSVMSVPESVAKQFTHRTLLEFFSSEDVYMTPSYFTGMIVPGMEGYKNIVLLGHHTKDQFMIDMEGSKYCYADQLLIDMLDGDSLKVSLPSMMVDRTIPVAPELRSITHPEISGALYPMAAQMFYDIQLALPTFGDVNLTSDYTADKEAVTITANGVVAPGILPEGESAFLNLFVVEDNVESYDQVFWDEDEADDFGGKFVHQGVVRLILTERYGNEVVTDENGNFTMTFNTEIDPESGWNPKNMRLVAFLSRDFNNNYLERTIINVNDINLLKSSTGIITPEADGNLMRVVVDNRHIKVEGAQKVEIYTVAGVEVNAASSLAPGMYVVKATVNGKTSTAKVLVK